jgi:UDP-N-acetylglucosamine--N-acetylmuramyl-(pentapeptide) pyrophosphoryl-undecaprenol N-acetylglucosamine transferase
MARHGDPAPRPRHALLAGGGTGGHVFPALAVAEELLARGWRVSFAGGATGLEARLVPARGIPFHVLPARPLVGKGAADQLRALATLGRSALAARRLVRELGAGVVLGTGGYASGPAVLGAALARRPVLLLEPNARAGAANRWLSRVASGAVVGYETAVSDLRCPAWVTGVPVRAAFFAVSERRPEGPPRLLVLGGSQGARQLNTALPPAIAHVREAVPDLRVLHQAGAKNVEETRAAYAAAGLLGPPDAPGAGALAPGADQTEIVPFLDDVAGAMAAADLVVSRAGALATAEICAAGRAALLVPLGIAQGHQGENARLLADAGAAVVVGSFEATPERLAAELRALLADPVRVARMGAAARALARPGAAAAIADRLEAIVAREGGR